MSDRQSTAFWTVAGLIACVAITATATQCARGTTAGKNGDRILTVGDYGDITLNEVTKAGDLTLKPGRYYFQHRVEGADHWIHFTELQEGGPPQHPVTENSTTIMMPEAKSHPGEVKCKLEPLKETARRTAIYVRTENGVALITRIEIAGEAVAHVFNG